MFVSVKQKNTGEGEGRQRGTESGGWRKEKGKKKDRDIVEYYLRHITFVII